MTSSKTPKIIRASEVKIKPIKWLWPDRIACGKPTLIAGQPGLGKGHITAYIAANVSMGHPWPDMKAQAPLGDVILLSAEDDPADTIVPRLIAAGADLERCHILEAVQVQKSVGMIDERCFDLGKDIDQLEQLIQDNQNVRLVIIDPISAYWGKVDSNNNTEVRNALSPLTALAIKYEVAILLVTHFNKSVGQDFIDKFIGSIGLIAAARAGYVVIKDNELPFRRYFLPAKNNNGNDRDGLGYVIEEVDLEDDNIRTSRVVWENGVIDAHSVLYPAASKGLTAANDAETFLQTLLADGPIPAASIMEQGKAEGLSYAVLRRALKHLGGGRKKSGYTEGWVWELPRSNLDEEVDQIVTREGD